MKKRTASQLVNDLLDKEGLLPATKIAERLGISRGTASSARARWKEKERARPFNAEKKPADPARPINKGVPSSVSSSPVTEVKETRVKGALVTLVKAGFEIEKLRVAGMVRLSHLKRRGMWDVETEKLVAELVVIEAYVDGRVGNLLLSHPAYPWFSRVKGVGGENIGKIVGPIEAFGHYYDPGDSLIPGFVTRTSESYFVVRDGQTEEKVGVWVEGIERLMTISALSKYSGFDVQDGKAPGRVAGSRNTYNSRLRSMCWRLGSSLLRAKGEFYSYYLAQKERYEQRYANTGVKIVPATSLPTNEKGKRYEPEGMISEGHVHNQALRKMIKLFLSCLWLAWREAEGLPVTKPYPIDKLGHDSFITPWEMVDRPEKKGGRRKEGK